MFSENKKYCLLKTQYFINMSRVIILKWNSNLNFLIYSFLSFKSLFLDLQVVGMFLRSGDWRQALHHWILSPAFFFKVGDRVSLSCSISDFLVCCNKILDQKDPEKGRIYSGLQFERKFKMAGKACLRECNSWSQGIHSQEAERDECRCSITSLLLILSRTPAHVM